MDEKDKREWMKNMCTDRRFLFISDSITKNDPNFSHNIEEFW